MLQIYILLKNIREFIFNLYTVLHTVWFMVHGVFRFVLRMIQAVPIFLNSLPVWVLPFAALSLAMGLALFILGRK